jgi:hypothetical protein
MEVTVSDLYNNKFLNSRVESHGDFSRVAHTYQRLKTAVSSSENFSTLEPTKKTAIEMILYKIARVLNGNPSEPEHWKDIAGYSNLAEEHLDENKNETKI